MTTTTLTTATSPTSDDSRSDDLVHRLLAFLDAAFDALPDPQDVPTTPREMEAYGFKRQSLLGRRSAIRGIRDRLIEVNPQIESLTRWKAFLVDARQTLADRLQPLHPSDHRASGLKLSLERIDRGLNLRGELYPANLPLDDLMKSAGYIPRDDVARAEGDSWFGSLPTVEKRLASLTAERDDALKTVADIAQAVGVG